MENIGGKFMAAAVAVAAFMATAPSLYSAQEDFRSVPSAWKWVGDDVAAFTYDGTYTDSTAFLYDARKGKAFPGTAPEKYADFPLHPEGAVNMTYSPDSTMIAFTRDNDLYVADIASGQERRLTFDGTDLILNGYASWVYYEEIFGRRTNYKAFWWSPDSRSIGFYRFDNTMVPLFPIYSPFGQDGTLRNTRYPKAGETNPQVRIGIADASGEKPVVWADFDPEQDQYFGTPFWGADSRRFFVSRMPRLQNTLDLYSVDAADGSKKLIYHEHYATWLDWISGMVFGEEGLYMVRSFETGWQQIYYLSYDGSQLRRLTDGENWDVAIVRVDEKKGDVYFTSSRDSRVRQSLYRVDRKMQVTALTDTTLDVRNVVFSPDGKYFAASLSNLVTPVKVCVFENPSSSSSRSSSVAGSTSSVSAKSSGRARSSAAKVHVVADMAYEGYSPEDYALGKIVWLTTPDGFRIPGTIVYPKDFDESGKYPVHVDIYGGPDTPMVRDRWVTPTDATQWWSDNGIIELTADCRASGHNGRSGLDMVYRQLTVWEVKDFVEWAKWLQSLPYVEGDKIGVEGFSFGGTMTSMLLMQAPEYFHYGIAGGGVYDWALYDSHYTERYMDTPQNNPDGYKVSRTIDYVGGYPTEYGRRGAEDDCRTGSETGSEVAGGEDHEGGESEPVMLKLTHGTGDDNVHFQNTLQLIDALQKAGKKFDFMIYPDGMHGYKGAQKEHFDAANREFWLHYLKGE